MEKYYEFNGKKYTIKDLQELSGMSHTTIRRRIKKGYPFENIIHNGTLWDRDNCKRYEYNGEYYTIRELAEIAEKHIGRIDCELIRHRIVYDKMDVTKAVEMPIQINRAGKGDDINIDGWSIEDSWEKWKNREPLGNILGVTR